MSRARALSGLLAVALGAGVAARAAVAGAPPAPGAPAAIVRVVTYNMLHGGVGSGLRGDGERLEARLAIAAPALAALAPDVVALQEASVGRGRGDVAARLAAAIGLPHALMAPPSTLLERLAAAVLGFDEGPALLSRLPVEGWRAWPLERCGETLPRAVLCARIATAAGPLQACSTHVDGSVCQARALARLLRERCREAPLVLMGDLNATDDAPAMRALLDAVPLTDAFRAVNPDAPGFTVWQPVTAPRARARRRVDYVLLGDGGGTVLRAVASRVVLDRPAATAAGALWPSDHYGVLADVALVARDAPRPVPAAACSDLAGQ